MNSCVAMTLKIMKDKLLELQVIFSHPLNLPTKALTCQISIGKYDRSAAPSSSKGGLVRRIASLQRDALQFLPITDSLQISLKIY